MLELDTVVRAQTQGPTAIKSSAKYVALLHKVCISYTGHDTHKYIHIHIYTDR